MRLSYFQRLFSHITIFALLISGVIWTIFNFIDAETYRLIMVFSLRLHGLAAFGFLIVFGMLLSTHIAFNWRVKKNRRISGIILTAFFVILIISGYCLYYVGSEQIRAFISYLHWILGILCSGIFVAHFLIKSKKKIPIQQTI